MFGYYALKDGHSDEHKRTFKFEVDATEWPSKEYAKSFEKVAKNEAGSLSSVQGIMMKSTEFLRRIVAPAGGQRKWAPWRICAHVASVFLLRRNLVGLDLKRRQQKTTRRGTAVGGAQSVEKKYEWRAPNRLLVVQTGVSASQAMVSKRLQHRKVCVKT